MVMMFLELKSYAILDDFPVAPVDAKLSPPTEPELVLLPGTPRAVPGAAFRRVVVALRSALFPRVPNPVFLPCLAVILSTFPGR